MWGIEQWLVGLVLAASAAAVQAQAPIRILHGSNAGAPQDIMLRVLAEEMRGSLGRPVLVEPRPGAEGQAAINALKQAPADGLTIFSDGTGITTILQMPGALHKWTDLEPLYRLQLDPFALFVRRGRYADMQAVISVMRTRPGGMRIGGYAKNGPHMFTTSMLGKATGGEFTWVPYDSGVRAITDVVGDHVDGAMSNISVYSQFKDKVSVLAHTSDARLPQFPDVPTFRELGINLVRYHWRGMFLKRGTPEDTIDRLFEGIGQAVKSQRFQQYLKDTATLDGTMSRADYAKMLEEQAKGDLHLLTELGALK